MYMYIYVYIIYMYIMYLDHIHFPLTSILSLHASPLSLSKQFPLYFHVILNSMDSAYEKNMQYLSFSV
jgi:hypothetical protein